MLAVKIIDPYPSAGLEHIVGDNMFAAKLLSSLMFRLVLNLVGYKLKLASRTNYCTF